MSLPSSSSKNQRESGLACYLLHAGFLLSLFFDHEDVGDMFRRNFGWLSKGYTVTYPRRENFS
jgi:hypothetical protein